MMENDALNALYVRDSEMWATVSQAEQAFLYVDNACVSEQWALARNHILIGVPMNDWKIALKDGQCVQVVAIGEGAWAVCPFVFDASLAIELLASGGQRAVDGLPFGGQLTGSVMDTSTLFLNQQFVRWAIARHLEYEKIEGGASLQTARIFPVVQDIGDIGLVLRWMLNEPQLQGGRLLWDESPKLSLLEIAEARNPMRETLQRQEFFRLHRPFLERNYANQVYHAIPNEG